MKNAARSTISQATQTDNVNNERVHKQELLKLVRIDESIPNRVVSREHSRLEFKESFNWDSKRRSTYAKTMAAFANTKGGYIVFGVKDSPRELVGLRGNAFDELDGKDVSGYLNSAFSPEIHWAAFPFEISGVTLGAIAISRCEHGPVICTKTDKVTLRESAIYYRYSGRTEQINPSELQKIIFERLENERKTWLEHLTKMARIGVENVGVLDVSTGELSGKGGKLLISPDLLGKIQFIREGQFTENASAGLPTLRVIGNVEQVNSNIIQPVRTVTRSVVFGEKEIMIAFLKQDRPDSPETYIVQASRERTPYTPIYYFALLAGFNLTKLKSFIKKHPHHTKQLLKRIISEPLKAHTVINASTSASVERQNILALLTTGKLESLRECSRIRLFETLTHLTPPHITEELRAFLVDIIQNEFDTLNGNEKTNLRKSIAYLDEALNYQRCTTLNH